MRPRRRWAGLLLLGVLLKAPIQGLLSFVPAASSPSRLAASNPDRPRLRNAERGRISRGESGSESRSQGFWWTRQEEEETLKKQAGKQQVQGEEGAASEWNGNLATLLIAQFPLFLGVGALLPVLPLYGKELGLSQSSIGLLVSSPSVAKLFLNVPMGGLADSIGRRPLMVVGMLILALGDIATGLAVGLPTLVAGRFVTGAGLAISDAGTGAWIADVTDGKLSERANFLGVQTAVISLAFVLGPAIGGWFVEQYGSASVFFVVAVGALICSAGFATLPEVRAEEGAKAAATTSSGRSENEEQQVSFFELIRSRDQQGLAGVSMAFYAGAACKFAVVPGVATQVFGASATEVGELFSLLAAAGIIGTLAGGNLTSSVGPRLVLAICGAACSIAYVAAAYATVIQAKYLFILSLALWALCGAAKSPALQSYAMEVAPSESRGSALSVPKTAGDLTFLVAPFILGVAADQLGSEVALGCCAAAFAVGTALFVVLTQPSNSPDSQLLAAQPEERRRSFPWQ